MTTTIICALLLGQVPTTALHDRADFVAPDFRERLDGLSFRYEWPTPDDRNRVENARIPQKLKDMASNYYAGVLQSHYLPSGLSRLWIGSKERPGEPMYVKFRTQGGISVLLKDYDDDFTITLTGIGSEPIVSESSHNDYCMRVVNQILRVPVTFEHIFTVKGNIMPLKSERRYFRGIFQQKEHPGFRPGSGQWWTGMQVITDGDTVVFHVQKLLREALAQGSGGRPSPAPAPAPSRYDPE